MNKSSHFLLPLILLMSFLTGSIVIEKTDLLNINEIITAQKLFGLNLTESEIEMALPTIQSNLDKYINNRKISLPNSIPPSVMFNPIPQGFEFPTTNNFKISDYSNTKLPENRDDLAYYSIGQLAYLIKSKQITSLELTKFFIERLKKYDPVLKAVITLTEDLALEQARKADQELMEGNYRGLLHGIPYGVKDLLSTKKYKTTWGAAAFKDQIIDEDATVVKKLTDAGAVLCAKLTMGALARGDVWFGGKTKNPWNIKQGSSGSSAGPASSVSAGLLPFAIGTETHGSIISPSTRCGVTGLRPTYGRVSRTGAMTLSWSMDKIGALCRNAEDLAIVLRTINGIDNIDLSLYDVPFSYSPKVDFSKLKIGYLKDDFNSKYSYHKSDSVTLKKLRDLGAKLIPIKLPDYNVRDISFILHAEASAVFEDLTLSNKDDLLVRQTKNAWPNTFRFARFIPAVEYLKANRIRFLIIQEMKKLFEDIDLYVSPSRTGSNLLLTNLTGNPSVVVPNGFSKEGSPRSFSFVGNLFDEGTIIAVAKAYQDATDFHLKHPKVTVK